MGSPDRHVKSQHGSGSFFYSFYFILQFPVAEKANNCHGQLAFIEEHIYSPD